MVDLNKEIKYVKGVGPNREVLLNKLKIYTLKDLITYYPRDYEDRSKPKNIYECEDGEEREFYPLVYDREEPKQVKVKKA